MSRRPAPIRSTRSTHRSSGRRYVSPYWLFGGLAAVLSLVLFLVLLALHVHWLIAWLLAWSAVTFAFYGYDKRQAQAGGWRVPENVLHALALLGGFPGGWAGRAYFHHKTLHPSFLVVLTASTLVWTIITVVVVLHH
jgi:uncharacterized membrane protein YsdA (DUF1294 family)